MADRMPRPPRLAGDGYDVKRIQDYLEKLAAAIDRALREQELKGRNVKNGNSEKQG